MCVTLHAAYARYTTCCMHEMSCVLWETAVSVGSGNERVEDLIYSVILRLRVCVILGQPFPWNVLPPAKEKSLQWYAHITLQKHKDDLKRPESEETGPV